MMNSIIPFEKDQQMPTRRKVDIDSVFAFVIIMVCIGIIGVQNAIKPNEQANIPLVGIMMSAGGYIFGRNSRKR